jgi:hypothetical protein
MRYKNNVLDKLVQLEATVNKVQFQVNRGVDQDQTLESVDETIFVNGCYAAYYIHLRFLDSYS